MAAPATTDEKPQTAVHRFIEEDYAPYETGGGPLDLVSYIDTPNLNAGFARFKKGAPMRDWPYWYDEVMFVTKGQGRITIALPPHTTRTPHEVSTGNLLFVPKGSKVDFEGLSEEPFEVLWVTSPRIGL